MCTFKCKDEGVYCGVNDRRPRHEERAQDAPLSSVWCRVPEFVRTERERRSRSGSLPDLLFQLLDIGFAEPVRCGVLLEVVGDDDVVAVSKDVADWG